MRHLFIINPAAGKPGSTARLEAQLSRLSFPHQVQYTVKEGDACRFAAQAAQDPSPIRIYACGGDGTLNEVVNGAAGHPHVAITNVPKGTGNDFLRIFGPNFREEFFDLEALAVGPQAVFDVLDCNGKLGLDMVCCGADSRVGAGVHRYKRLPLIGGGGAYVLATLEQIFFHGLSQEMEVELCGQTYRGGVTILCIGNGQHYGGGFHPLPEALPDDGIFDVLLIPKISMLTLARHIGQFASGRHRECPQYIQEFHTSGDIVFRSREELLVAIDGELLRSHEFRVRRSEKAVNFFYPAHSTYQSRT